MLFIQPNNRLIFNNYKIILRFRSSSLVLSSYNTDNNNDYKVFHLSKSIIRNNIHSDSSLSHNKSHNDRFKEIYKAFEIYKRLNNITGLFNVPQNFVVPFNDNNWSKEIWGMKLGKIDNKIRCSKAWNNYRLELEELGFDYRPQKKIFKFKEIYKAFETYKRLNNITGLFSVNHRFVVPFNDNNWPEEIWGMNLGRITNNIRGRNDWKDYRLKLEELGFDYSSQQVNSFDDIYIDYSSQQVNSFDDIYKHLRYIKE